MSAQSRLLAWLSAAVWLRWRLMRLKAARLLGGRPAALAGPDYHLAPTETPVDGLDYDPAELPDDLIARLELTRAELLDARPRRVRRAPSRSARRLRVGSLAAVGALAAGAVGAGAAALVTGSTGVPAVDRVLGIYESELDRPGDVRPRTNGPNIFVDVPGSGSRRLVSSAYVARDGRICTALTGADGNAPTSVGAVACLPPSLLASHLVRDGGVAVAVSTVGDRAVVRGFVSDRVARLSGDGPGGPLEVHLSSEWLADVSGIGPMRTFVALADDALGGGAGGPSGTDPLLSPDLGSYVFDAVTRDGEQIRIERSRAP
jgi:hypothetical protein